MTVISPPTTIGFNFNGCDPDELPALDCDRKTVIHLKELAAGAEMVLSQVEILYRCQAQDVVSIKYCPRGPV
jgi:hypothetical protein